MKTKIRILTIGFILLLTACSNFKTNENGITTITCNSGYVKHLKYDEREIRKFKEKRKKSAFLIGDIDDIGKCDRYPCNTCKLFMCKDAHFDSIKYVDSKNGQIFESESYELTNDNQNYVKKFSKMKKIKKLKSDYIWNVYSKDNLEYEQVFNKNNGYLVYEMIIPDKLTEKVVVNECDVSAYSIFNNFYHRW